MASGAPLAAVADHPAAPAAVWRSDCPVHATPQRLPDRPPVAQVPAVSRSRKDLPHEWRRKPCAQPAEERRRHLFLQSRHLGDALRRRTRPGARHALYPGPVRGRGDRIGRRLRAHVGQAGGDAAALWAGPRQRSRQPAQRAARADADRQHRGRPGDLPSPERRAADRRYRGLGARRIGLGADGNHICDGGRRCRRGGAGGAHPSRTDRHADPAVGHLVGRGRRDRRGTAGAAEAAFGPRPGRATPPTSCAAACRR